MLQFIKQIAHSTSGIRTIFYMLLTSLCVGVVGFMLIEHLNFIDALYLSIITLSTVGFETVKPLSESGKIFVIIYIFFNLGVFTYSISVISKFFFDGKFKNNLNYIYMMDQLEKIEKHVIVCGGGRNGTQAIEIVKGNNVITVLIDKDKEKEEVSTADFFIHGDSTLDEDLLKAGILRASAIIVATPSDSENLFTVLSARQLNKNIRIISRASQENSRNKLKLAGADNVILPEHIGGAYMASLVFTSDIKEFMDILTNSNHASFRMRELSNSKTISLGNLRAWEQSGATIIGIKKADNSYVPNPQPDFEINPSQKIIAMGSDEQLSKLESLIV